MSIISYRYSFLSIYCIPLLCYKNIINIINEQKRIIIVSYLIFFLLFSLPIVFWCYFYKNAASLIFIYFLCLLLLMFLIIFLLIIVIKKMLNCISHKVLRFFLVALGNTILHFMLYNMGFFFTSGCVFPIYFLITPLSYFGNNGIPFFLWQYPFLYFFIYQIIICFVFQNRFLIILYFIYSVFCFFYIPKIDYYWDKNINLTFESYLYGNKYIFPEHMFFINEPANINYLIDLAKKESKEIIAGIGWYKRNQEQLIEKNGIIIVDSSGFYNIYEKKHYLRFCETGTPLFYLFDNQNRPSNIFICSEFFLGKIKKIDKNKNILIASTIWTDCFLTFLYRDIMRRIYDLMIL